MGTKLTDFAAAQRHRYRVTPGGATVPGVTSIIGVIDKPGMMWSAAGIAAQAAIDNGRRKRTIVPQHRAWLADAKGRTASAEAKRQLAALGSDNEVYAHWCRGEFDRQWRKKADRGTRVHGVAEAWSKGESVEVVAEDEPYVDALEMFHTNYKPKFRLVECIVLNADHEYGGRFDGVVELDGPHAQGVFLVDYKTGKEYAFECAMQAIGYWNSGLAIYDDAGALANIADLPADIDGCRTIYLREDGTVGVKDPFAQVRRQQAWDAFLACRAMYRISKEVETQLNESEDE